MSPENAARLLILLSICATGWIMYTIMIARKREKERKKILENEINKLHIDMKDYFKSLHTQIKNERNASRADWEGSDI